MHSRLPPSRDEEGEKVHPVAFHVGANIVSPTTNSETLGQSADFIRPGLPQADDKGGSTSPAGLLQEVREVLRGIQDYKSPLSSPLMRCQWIFSKTNTASAQCPPVAARGT